MPCTVWRGLGVDVPPPLDKAAALTMQDSASLCALASVTQCRQSHGRDSMPCCPDKTQDSGRRHAVASCICSAPGLLFSPVPDVQGGACSAERVLHPGGGLHHARHCGEASPPGPAEAGQGGDRRVHACLALLAALQVIFLALSRLGGMREQGMHQYTGPC